MLSDKSQQEQVLALAERFSRRVLDAYGAGTPGELVAAAVAVDAVGRDPAFSLSREEILQRAQVMNAAWKATDPQERERLCNGWREPADPLAYPDALELLDEQGVPSGSVDVFLALDCHATGRNSASLEFGLSRKGDVAATIFIPLGTRKRDALHAIEQAQVTLDLRWEELVSPQARTRADLPETLRREMPGGPRKNRQGLALALEHAGEAGERIAGFVMDALTNAPAELHICRADGPDRSTWEVLGELCLRVDDAGSVTVKLVDAGEKPQSPPKPTGTRRGKSARKAGK